MNQPEVKAVAHENAIWTTLTLSSLARSAAQMEATFEQGPPQVLAQEFSQVVENLHASYAIEGTVDALTLLKCSGLASELKRYSSEYSVELFRSELASL